jgi:hypothetical protein
MSDKIREPTDDLEKMVEAMARAMRALRQTYWPDMAAFDNATRGSQATDLAEARAGLIALTAELGVELEDLANLPLVRREEMEAVSRAEAETVRLTLAIEDYKQGLDDYRERFAAEDAQLQAENDALRAKIAGLESALAWTPNDGSLPEPGYYLALIRNRTHGVYSVHALRVVGRFEVQVSDEYDGEEIPSWAEDRGDGDYWYLKPCWAYDFDDERTQVWTPQHADLIGYQRFPSADIARAALSPAQEDS